MFGFKKKARKGKKASENEWLDFVRMFGVDRMKPSQRGWAASRILKEAAKRRKHTLV